MSAEFEDYFNQVESLLSDCVGGNDRYALKHAHKNYFRIKTGFYEDENPEDITKEICMSVNESLNKCGNKNNNLNESVLKESSKTDLPVRTVVRHMTDFIKLKMDDTLFLPEQLGGEEMEYHFDGLPTFSVEFSVDWDPTIEKDYILDGRTVDEGDIIEIEIKINPSLFPNSMYDIIGDLNEILRHELEHVMQDAGYRSPDEIRLDDKPEPTDKTYYMQAHEIPAEIRGFRRLVKLRKQSPEEVIKNWFDRNKIIHQLPDEDIEELTTFLTQKYKEYYGR